MPAYVFGNIMKISDPDRFSQYQRPALQSVEQYGGKVVAGGTKIEIADGNWLPDLVLVLEFEDLGKAKEWYHSPEYQAVVGGRFESSEGGVVFAEFAH
jgi:uncharacterized protein (DUF1330 family)